MFEQDASPPERATSAVTRRDNDAMRPKGRELADHAGRGRHLSLVQA